jgi:hypothetical protein
MNGMYGVEASGDAESIRMRESVVDVVVAEDLSLGSCCGRAILLISAINLIQSVVF